MADRMNTSMMHMESKDWLAQHDEGFVLPDRPPLVRLPKINTAPFTVAYRERFHPTPVRKIGPFGPPVQMVKEIMPNELIPKSKPLAALKPRNPLS
jgi:hypothetical protein